MTFLQRHFPKNKASWKTYAKIFIPIILGSTLFALNGVVDNFMVGHINQGVTALGAINSWSNILTGWFLGTAAAGSVVMAQFYHAKKFDIVKQIARYRYILTMIAALTLAAVAWSTPDSLTRTFYSGTSDAVVSNARMYSKVIAIQWIMVAVTFNLGNQLRELGYGKYTMMWAFGSLTANVVLNATLMYGLGMGVDGAAWASVAGRVVSFTAGISVIIWKKVEIGFKPWTIFKVSWHVQKLFWKRWIYFMAIFTVTFFVTYRNFFYDRGFVTHSMAVGVGALSVMGLTTALMNVFTTTFSALASMSAFFVGSELGKGNLDAAKQHGDELKGFMTLMAFILAIVAIIFATCVPYMPFLSKEQTFTSVAKGDPTKLTGFYGLIRDSGVKHTYQAYQDSITTTHSALSFDTIHKAEASKSWYSTGKIAGSGLANTLTAYHNDPTLFNHIYTGNSADGWVNTHILPGGVSFDSKVQLIQVRNSLYTIACFYPIWIWFSSSYRIGNSGGRGGWFAFVDWFVSGPIQMGWLAILMLVIVPASPFLQGNFAFAYFLFFLSDLLKLVFQEILYYKYKWLHSLTKEEEAEKDASAKKYLNEDIKAP